MSDFPDERPALGDIKVGDEVFVIDGHLRGKATPKLARIAKIGRVWLDIEAVASRRTWRMRKNTQDDGSKYYSTQSRFYTLAQMEWHDRLNVANNALHDVGIRVDRWSDWSKPSRRVALAELIARYEAEHES